MRLITSYKVFFVTLTVLLSAAGVLANAESTKCLDSANSYYQNYLTTKNKELLDKAYLNYYKASEIEPSASSYLGMGMVFIEKKMNAQAKKYLYKAYSVDENDATANYYLGLYSYNNEEYLRALDFYKKAYANGLSGNYDVNLKIGTIYEKVGDISKAKRFYESALKLNSSSQEAKSRLKAIEQLEAAKIKNNDN